MMPAMHSKTMAVHAARTRSGFTLIEVMIALAIIAILATVALPSYEAYVVKTRRVEARAALLKTMQLQEQYYTRFNKYLAFDHVTAIADLPFRPYTGDTASGSYYGLTAQACGSGAGETIDVCVLLIATPGKAASGRAFNDALCGTLSLNSKGMRHASGKGGDQCWQ